MTILATNLLKTPNLLQTTNLVQKANLIQAGSAPVQPTPTFDPVAGVYSGAQNVTITSSGADAIYYTLDGSTPTTSSTLYSGPVTVSSSLTLKALAVKAGFTNSGIGSAAYTINVAAPTFVQQKIAFDGSTAGTASPCLLTAPVTAGNSLIVYVTFSGGHATGGVPTDDAGNTYVLLREPDTFTTGAGGVTSTYVYTCLAVVGTPQTITVHGNANANVADPFIVVIETTPAHVDDSHYAAVTFNSGADVDGGSVTSTAASDLLLLFAAYVNGGGSQAFSAGTGWTLTSQLGDSGFLGARAAFEQQTAGAANAYEAFIQVVSNAGGGGMTTLALKG